MKKTSLKIVLYILTLFFVASCAMKDDINIPQNDSIVLDISSGMTKMEDTQAESFVSHLDVFIFQTENGVPQNREYYGRYQVNNSPTLTLKALRTDFEQDREYVVYIVANTTIPSPELASNVLVYDDLLNTMQEDPNLHLSALNIGSDETNTDDIPRYFLMDAVAEDGYDNTLIKINDADPTKELLLTAKLSRAAAKVVINIEASENVTFKSYTYEEGSEGGLYYLRNLPYDTYLLAEARPAETIYAKVRNTNKTINSYFTWNPEVDNKKVSLTTYVYPNHWTNEGILEHETSVIMNLPMVYNHNGELMEFHNSWYKIPMTDDQKFERNNYYEVNILLNRPGAITEVTPIELSEITYSVEEWTNVDINIDGQDTPEYLMVSRDTLEMHNIAIDATSLDFASSSPVTISARDIYYYNKFGIKVSISGNFVEATTPAGSIAGKITVESPVPTNNAIRYFTLVVKNQENITREVFVIQYPLEYITNIYAWYSYRDDFFYAAGRTNDEDGQSVPTTYEVQGDRISSATWSSGAWRLNKASTNGAFVSKVSGTQTSSGSAPIYYYYYDRSYFGDVEVQQSTAISRGNPRMYHVQIKATSDTYTVAIPKMNETTGYTEDTDDNSKLVSPSFMIASQLGAVSSGSFNNYEMAASHCREYVEVYKDPVTGETVHLTNWRLPTRAEVEIIIKFQNDSEVMDEVLAGEFYWCADSGRTGQYVRNPDYSQSGSGLRCIRDAY